MATLPGSHGAPLRTARELERSGDAAEIYDEGWRLRWVSPELCRVLGRKESELGIGRHILDLFGREPWRSAVSERSRLEQLQRSLPFFLHGTSEEDLREVTSQTVLRQIEKTEARRPPAIWNSTVELVDDSLPALPISCLAIRFSEEDFTGYARIYSSGMRASLLSLVARGSEEMFERMSRLVEPGRHPVAIMFCDLEKSADLARRIPSPVYFELLSSLAKAIDDVVVRHDGIVGKHAGDGASAYFLADDHGQVSAAVRAAIVSADEIAERAAKILDELCSRYGIGGISAPVNVGLHWGSTVYMGQIVSGGRLEVSALGDEVNDCARLETAARGGRTLASKALLERLSRRDASSLGIDLLGQTYKPLREMENVPRKALRDCAHLPVCELRRRST